MDYRDKLQKLFEQLPALKLTELARKIGADPSNMAKYSKGQLQISESKYNEIIKGLRDLFEEMQTVIKSV